MVCVDSNRLGRAARIDDAAGRYIEFCKASVSRGFRLTGMHIVLDCANGATYHVAPRVLEELGANVTIIGADPDGFNINEGCGSTAPAALAAKVLELAADLGIALDGDGDRLIMVDENGVVVDGDQLIYAMATHRAGNGTLQGGVVGTLMSNFGLERAFDESGIEFFRASVGDRYVLEALRERGWSLGGESSGHIICLDLTTTGDAIVAALQVVSAMSERQRTLSELVSGMTKAPQTLLNVSVAAPQQRVQEADVLAAVEAKSQVLAGRGRVLIRPSGTEPVVRVMVEGDSAGEVTAVAEELAALVAAPMSR
jgi:phosphoglucosamine mutase